MGIKILQQALLLLGFIILSVQAERLHDQIYIFSILFGGFLILVSAYGLGQKSKK